MSNADVYRPKSNLIFAGIGIVLSAFFLWSSFYQGGAATEGSSACAAIFIVICIYIFLIRPKVTFFDEGIVITNPLEEITIGWADVIMLDSKWALAVKTKDFTVSAWAATAPGRHHARNIHAAEIKGLDVELGGSMRTADSPRSDSGATAYRARVRLQRFENTSSKNSLTTARERDLKPALTALVFLIAAVGINFLGH